MSVEKAMHYSVVVYDLSDRTQIEITGADRAKLLHGFCTNDIKALQPGQGCEAFLTNIKGRVLGHLYVFATPSSLWLDTFPGHEATIITHLERYVIREDVNLIGKTNECGALLVTGPHAAQLLMLDNGLAVYGTVTREAFGNSFDVRRVDMLNQPGFLISGGREFLQSMRQSLLAIGCINGTAVEFEARRIEAGFPVYGRDISDENLAQEVARTRQCISFTKGCYLGQEPIARLDAMGHTNRELRRISFEPGSHPAAGMVVLASDSDDEAGVLTSVSPIPDPLGAIAALGYLKTRFNREGTHVRIVSEQSHLGTVLAAPA